MGVRANVAMTCGGFRVADQEQPARRTMIRTGGAVFGFGYPGPFQLKFRRVWGRVEIRRRGRVEHHRGKADNNGDPRDRLTHLVEHIQHIC